MRVRCKYWTPLFAGLLALTGVAAAKTESLKLDDGTEISIQKLSTHGNPRVLWLPSEAGEQPGELAVARRLARLGVEVWYADTLAARFLPAVRSSMQEIPATDVAALLQHALRGNKPVVVVSAGQGAAPLVRGVIQLRNQAPSSQLAGAVLLSPNLYVATPDVGAEAEFLPEVTQAKIPIAILQAEQSPWRWRLDSLAAELNRSGSDVRTRVLPGVRDRFYFRPNATAAERKAAAALPTLLRDTLMTLTSAEKNK